MVTFLIGWLSMCLFYVFVIFLIGAAFRLIFKGIDEDDVLKVILGAALGIATIASLKHITEKEGERRKQLHAGNASSAALHKRS